MCGMERPLELGALGWGLSTIGVVGWVWLFFLKLCRVQRVTGKQIVAQKNRQVTFLKTTGHCN
uniref:Uncharacterized protein n=1 Tax=Anguilla anguilla TaxID=7936 RepID=A0A0E9W804_ANGAN